MTQDAIVIKRLEGGMAEVAVTRGTACGSNCGSCESCIFQSELRTRARNLIDAKPGQRVLIETRSSRIYGAALLVYILPLALALVGFAIAHLLGAEEGPCVAASFVGVILGAIIIVLSQRIKKGRDPITYDIVEFTEAV